jgi:hypothetical protein
MDMTERAHAKFISFFRLTDACRGPGCPVCRCLIADTRQYLDSVLYEQVTDPGTRSRLRASWGFCNRHTWMLKGGSDPAFGSAIIHEDLLRGAIRRFERLAGRAAAGRRFVGRFRALVRRPRLPLLVELYHRRPPCPACGRSADSEARYIDAALQWVDDPQFDRAYGESEGLCLPHALRALEVDRGRGAATLLLARTLPMWRALRKDLEAFVSKHDYRNREPFTEAEATAYARAFEALTGAPGLFPSDRRQEVSRRAPRPSARSSLSARAAVGGESYATAERARLELRIKELGEQLDEATSRAAALQRRLTQVVEERDAFARSLSGERGANETNQRVIAELRREVDQLKADAARPPEGGGPR